MQGLKTPIIEEKGRKGTNAYAADRRGRPPCLPAICAHHVLAVRADTGVCPYAWVFAASLHVRGRKYIITFIFHY